MAWSGATKSSEATEAWASTEGDAALCSFRACLSLFRLRWSTCGEYHSTCGENRSGMHRRHGVPVQGFRSVFLGTSLWERLFGNVSYGRPIIALERQSTAIRMGGSRRWRAVEAGLFQMPGNCKGERATATAGLAGVGALAAAGASGSGPSRTFGRGAQAPSDFRASGSGPRLAAGLELELPWGRRVPSVEVILGFVSSQHSGLMG